MIKRVRFKKFLPPLGTRVKIVIDANYDWRKEYEYLYDGYVWGWSEPELVKFKDPNSGENVIMKYRDIDIWTF